jgi:hypothetical protein
MKTSRPTSVQYVNEFVVLDYHVFNQQELERFTATAMEAARNSPRDMHGENPLPVAQHIREWEAKDRVRDEHRLQTCARVNAALAAGASIDEALEMEMGS